MLFKTELDMKKDKRIDDYIKRAKPFARPVLNHLRELVHQACPEVSETIKWGMPSFEHQGPMFGFAAFNQHCAVGFWKASLMKDPQKILTTRQEEKSAMGNLGSIKSLDDLPSDKVMLAYIREAVRLNEEGVKLVRKKPAGRKELVIPKELTDALSQPNNKKAKAVFNAFSDSHKREYAEWISEAKTEVTREKRLLTTIEWLEEGKARNWKYSRTKKQG